MLVNQITEFASQHTLMIGAAAALLVAIVYLEFKHFTRKYDDLTVHQAVRLINSGDSLLLDVRQAKEMANGKIEGAVHIPVGQVRQRLEELGDYREKPVLVYCHSGSRSAMVCGQLISAGFTGVHNLKGGIAVWENENLPLVKK